MKVNDVYGEGGDQVPNFAPQKSPDVNTQMVEIKMPKLTEVTSKEL